MRLLLNTHKVILYEYTNNMGYGTVPFRFHYALRANIASSLRSQSRNLNKLHYWLIQSGYEAILNTHDIILYEYTNALGLKNIPRVDENVRGHSGQTDPWF